ncbi:hypothetical protein ACQ4PT_022702 [Festuca glaucescens]
MSGVPRKVIEHHLAVFPGACPVKQRVRRQAPQKQQFIVEEVEKLKKAQLIESVAHAGWLANPVVVPKPAGGGHLCIDFTDLNKACPKDPYPLPRIDEIVDSTAGCDLLCFLDAFSGYHQIKMAKEDADKTTFTTPCGIYCYTGMPFGLKNAGATFQWLMCIALGEQMGRNAEAYVDDIVVKTRKGDTLIEDLRETFTNLRKVNIKLNPAKCVFGVPSGKLLGFLVSHRGIEANPDKIRAIEEMKPPRKLKDIQRLTGCLAALGCFIARLGEKALPFFKLMKKTGEFKWTLEADEAFAALKRYLTSPPVMVAPRTRETLLLYLAAIPRTASAVLVAEREGPPLKNKESKSKPKPQDLSEEGTSPDSVLEVLQGDLAETAPPDGLDGPTGEPTLAEALEPSPEETSASRFVQHPVYFVSMVLREARERVVTKYLLETVLHNPNATGRVAEQAIELQPFELTFDTTPTKKSRALAEFTAEWTDASPDDGEAEEETQQPAILTSPTGDKLRYVVQFCFKDTDKCSNNIAEYEGLLAGLRAAVALGVKRLIVQGDSQLLVHFSNKVYKPKDDHMIAYLEEVRRMEKHFLGLGLTFTHRGDNKEADEIARQASRGEAQRPGVFEERLFQPSTRPPSASQKDLPEDLPPPPTTGAPDCGPPSGNRLVVAIAPQEAGWIDEIRDYLKGGLPPENDDAAAESLVRRAKNYCLIDGELYCRRPNGVALRCIPLEEGKKLIDDIHAGECSHQSSARTLAGKAFRSGFYWPTALDDAIEIVKSCEACQFHAKQIHQPAQGLQTIPLSWPFAVWGLDILGPFPRALGGYRFLFIAVDKFTKWVEVEAVRTIPARSAVKFIKGLVCRFGVPNRIITDNGSQFTSGIFKSYYADIGTKICYASVAHP